MIDCYLVLPRLLAHRLEVAVIHSVGSSAEMVVNLVTRNTMGSFAESEVLSTASQAAAYCSIA